MEFFEYIIMLMLSIIGIISIIKSAILVLCRDNSCRCKIVIPLDDSCENPETVIRNTAVSLEWSDKKRYSEIVCVYQGNNEESKEICRRVCEDYPFTYYCDINNFQNSVFYSD